MSKATFNNMSGLTEYALSCGVVQSIYCVVDGSQLSLTLRRCGKEYRVRAANHDDVQIIEWHSRVSLSAARRDFEQIGQRLFGDAIRECRATGKYDVKVNRDQHGVHGYDAWLRTGDDEYVAVGTSTTEIGAWVEAYTFMKKTLRKSK